VGPCRVFPSAGGGSASPRGPHCYLPHVHGAPRLPAPAVCSGGHQRRRQYGTAIHEASTQGSAAATEIRSHGAAGSVPAIEIRTHNNSGSVPATEIRSHGSAGSVPTTEIRTHSDSGSVPAKAAGRRNTCQYWTQMWIWYSLHYEYSRMWIRY
jgi:hypothetical protein